MVYFILFSSLEEQAWNRYSECFTDANQRYHVEATMRRSHATWRPQFDPRGRCHQLRFDRSPKHNNFKKHN